MAEIILKCEKEYEICCPVCGTPESKSPVRYPDAQAPGESWIQCVKCGTSYKPPKWQAAGGGSYNIPTWPPGDGGPGYRGNELEIDVFYGDGGGSYYTNISNTELAIENFLKAIDPTLGVKYIDQETFFVYRKGVCK